MKRILIIFILFLSNSCAINNTPLITNAHKISDEKGMKVEIHHGKDFNIFTLQKISSAKKPIRIYIEGDGDAYINRYRPSYDPTPKNGFLLSLLRQDQSPNLIYIARPCQYVDSPNCEEKYWTSERFSAEAISAIQEVIDSLPKDQKLELIGYSGGAQIVLHLTNQNIRNIRTIAGNLDLEKFSQFHKIPKLNTPPIDYIRISKIRQTHFVGTADPIMPIDVFKSYKSRMRKKNCINLRLVPNASHKKNWVEQWNKLLQKRPLCR